MIFERDLSSTGLHHLGILMTGGAVVVLLLAVLVRRPRPGASPVEPS